MPSSWICLDASIIIRLVANPKDTKLVKQFQTWQAKHQLVAPHLLYFEVTNALHQYQKHQILSSGAVQSALKTAQALPVQLHSDALLHQQALQLADAHKLSATYDAHYLALAQRLGAGLWTADKKLHNSVKKKLKWVNLWK